MLLDGFAEMESAFESRDFRVFGSQSEPTTSIDSNNEFGVKLLQELTSKQLWIYSEVLIMRMVFGHAAGELFRFHDLDYL
jgi:hypothetical protein